MRVETSTFGNDDRYIVNRKCLDFDKSHILLNTQNSPTANKMRKLQLLTNQNTNSVRVLQSDMPAVGKKLTIGTLQEEVKRSQKRVNSWDRQINSFPIDVIQAHDASTQFFHNILDMSCKNMSAVALNNYVFLWDLNTNTYLSYEKNRTTPLTSLSWNPDGSQLAVCKKHYLDLLGGPTADRLVRRIPMEYTYSSLSWRNNLVTCGSTRSVIHGYDVRINAERPTLKFCPGKERANNPVASVKWNPSGRYLVTSDPLNSVNIWDVLNLKTPLTTFKKHKSTVKGLAWCPYESGTLASGGGYFDGKVYVWNCNNGKVSSSISLNSQVTGLIWSEMDRELLTAHARKGQNNEEDKFSNSKILFWKYQSSKTSPSHLQKLNHSLCNTEEIISITNNNRFFLALGGFNCPKLYLWEKIFTKVPTRLVKTDLNDLSKFK